MNYNEYKPNEKIVDRAVELWKRALGAPVYRNTAPGSPGNTPANDMASLMVAVLPKNNTPEILGAFGSALKKLLMEKQPYRHNPESADYIRSLGVDYDPDEILDRAAKEAGLKMKFPWKTNMYIYGDRLMFSTGYAGARMHHYPLPDGRWLVADLSGDDMDKIIALAASGVETGLTIEGVAA